MKTIDIELILLKECNFSQNLVVSNVSFGMKRQIKFGSWTENEWDVLHECDMLKVTNSGYATEYEIKVSKSDFLADFKKKHNHNSRFIKQFYYVVPEFMKDYVLERIPKNAGLICILESGKCLYIKDAEIRKDAFKWTQSEMFKLARLGAMRIFNLKNNIKKLSLKNIKVNP